MELLFSFVKLRLQSKTGKIYWFLELVLSIFVQIVKWYNIPKTPYGLDFTLSDWPDWRIPLILIRQCMPQSQLPIRASTGGQRAILS